ncbi:MAG: NADH-quinone oxidoreductase subunit NuoE [Candidatus Poribacteria bacterium]|nr:NADH-quinone oxidoreductase subunit NuoE [Candidatus Poribacteria bacterium]
MAFEFTPENLAEFNELVTHYPQKRAVMLPALHIAQKQNGWISPDVMDYIAKQVGVSTAQVQDVVTFYPMFFDHEVNKHIIRVCHTLPCALCNCRAIKDHLAQKLGVPFDAPGDSNTADGKFTLLSTECLAACDKAPVMMVDDDLYENLTPEKVDAILAKF